MTPTSGGTLKSMNRKAHGFTIVELLIVIVVIAILAAISVAAYTNIKDRANQSANQATVRSYIQAFQLIKAETGSLPAGYNENSSCLGPDPQPNPCTDFGQTASAASTANTKNLLAKYGMVSQPGIVGGANGTYKRLIYTERYYGEPALLWRVPINQECIGSGGRFHWGAGWVDGVTYSSRGTYTYCYMSLRDL